MTWEIFHPADPYAGFPHHDYPLDLQGWNCDDPTFEELFRAVKPATVIEVGAWKGGSAVHMADLAKRVGLPTQILCVDTWLGSLEMWRKGDPRYQLLNHRHGRPAVYEQFLANVIKCGHTDRITPLPLPSTIAARLIPFKANLIYIDASHEYEDVLADLRAYRPLLTPGGVLFGDDYVGAWPGVCRAVDEFAGGTGMRLQADQLWRLYQG